MMIVFWVALVVLAVWAIRSLQVPGSTTRSNAIDILERRFAADEIEFAEFEERRRALEEHREIRR